jgi:hypothetical protein
LFEPSVLVFSCSMASVRELGLDWLGRRVWFVFCEIQSCQCQIHHPLSLCFLWRSILCLPSHICYKSLHLTDCLVGKFSRVVQSTIVLGQWLHAPENFWYIHFPSRIVWRYNSLSFFLFWSSGVVISNLFLLMTILYSRVCVIGPDASVIEREHIDKGSSVQ